MEKQRLLSQIIAIEKGTKSRAETTLSEAHKLLAKKELLFGMSKVYQPLEDGGERLPDEKKVLQVRAEEVVKETAEVLADLFDVTAVKDWTNCSARASVVVDGVELLRDVPATHLLFLEKQLVNIRTFVDSLPVLDTADEWRWDDKKECFVTEPVDTVRTKKIPKVITKFQPTKEHAGQADVIAEDVQIGWYKTTKMSGALPKVRVSMLRERVEKLQRAVKFAREAANSREAEKVEVGKKVFDYLFPPTNGK